MPLFPLLVCSLSFFSLLFFFVFCYHALSLSVSFLHFLAFISAITRENLFSLLSQKTEGRENVITLYTISFKCLASIALSISQNFFFSPNFIEFKLSKINKVKEMIQRKRKKSLTSEGDCALESPFKTFFLWTFPAEFGLLYTPFSIYCFHFHTCPVHTSS